MEIETLNVATLRCALHRLHSMIHGVISVRMSHPLPFNPGTRPIDIHPTLRPLLRGPETSRHSGAQFASYDWDAPDATGNSALL